MSLENGLMLAAAAISLILILRAQQKEIAMLMGICTALMLFLGSSQKITFALQQLLQWGNDSWTAEMGNLLIKNLGIAYAAQITADICREAGETTMGSQVELLAKAEIVLLCLPMAQRIFDIAESLLS
jgi:stage III sporulation protein AD